MRDSIEAGTQIVNKLTRGIDVISAALADPPMDSAGRALWRTSTNGEILGFIALTLNYKIPLSSKRTLTLRKDLDDATDNP